MLLMPYFHVFLYDQKKGPGKNTRPFLGQLQLGSSLCLLSPFSSSTVFASPWSLVVLSNLLGEELMICGCEDEVISTVNTPDC